MACMLRGEPTDGIAIDDGVAVVIDGHNSMLAFSARAGAGAYAIRRSGDTAVCTPLTQAIKP